MSEFTSGCLTLVKYKEWLTELSPTYMTELNDEWLVFITKDTFVDEDIPDSLYEISNKFPVMYFYNFEDHCWGYSIVSNSQEVANVHVSYELEYTMLMSLAEERYPEEDPNEFLYDDVNGSKIRENLEEELQNSKQYKELINQQFLNCNVDSFKLFGISDEQINELVGILTSDYLMQLESDHQLVEEFKEILHIQEMSWIRSDRIDELED